MTKADAEEVAETEAETTRNEVNVVEEAVEEEEKAVVDPVGDDR